MCGDDADNCFCVLSGEQCNIALLYYNHTRGTVAQIPHTYGAHSRRRKAHNQLRKHYHTRITEKLFPHMDNEKFTVLNPRSHDDSA